MFVYSIKSKQLKIILLGAFALITAVCLFILSKDVSPAARNSAVQIKASTAEERLSFLSQFGWELEADPVEVCEVIIPAEFDETYTKYNEIQKAQGFDLTPYAGMRVKRWTYRVKNYPAYEDKSCIRANILVCDGIVIGGDVCSVELDGFMHGFELSK